MFINKCVMVAVVISASLFGSSTALAAPPQEGQVQQSTAGASSEIPFCQALDVLSGYKWHRSAGDNEQYGGLVYVISSSSQCVFSTPFNWNIVSFKDHVWGDMQPRYDAQTTKYYYQVGAYHFYSYVLIVPHTVHSNQAANRCPFPAFC